MRTRFVLAAGTTRTAAIDGISAAGANPDVLPFTPSADAELLVYGHPVSVPDAPVSPTGCPTPAVVTRALHELHEVDCTVIDAGLARPTAAPTVDIGATPGGDIRTEEPVPDAQNIYQNARDYAAAISDDHLVLAETIPGGTTTALGVLSALGVSQNVSSSLPSNPLELKRRVVDDALESLETHAQEEPADDHESPASSQMSVSHPSVYLDPLDVVRHVGDPVLAVVSGLAVGGLSRGATVTLAGGTQQLAVAAICRAQGYTDPLTIATTPYVATDDTASFYETAAELDLDVTVTDPKFSNTDHPGLGRYPAGEGKEGVGMGGALALAADAGIDMATVREQAETVYDRVVDR